MLMNSDMELLVYASCAKLLFREGPTQECHNGNSIDNKVRYVPQTAYLLSGNGNKQ